MMLDHIIWAFSILGSLVVLLLFMRVRAVDVEHNLAKYRSKDAGFCDLLNYGAMIDDGIVIMKNGSLMCSWLYRCPDNASSTDGQKEMISFRINQALAPLGSGWMLHVDAVRRPASNYSQVDASAFPDRISEAIDEERRNYFEGLGTLYEGYSVLSLTWFPPVIAQKKMTDLMFDDDRPTPDKKTYGSRLLEQFKQDINSFESRLSAALVLTRLKCQKVQHEDGSVVNQDDLLSWLQFCITGKHHPVVLPSNPMYLDSVLGGQEVWGGVVPKIGRNFCQVVSIEGFPLESYPGVLSQLAELPVEYRWSSRFIFMDDHEAVKHLEKLQKKWKQRIRGFFDQLIQNHSGPVNEDAMAMVSDASEALAEVHSGLVRMGYYTSVIVLMSEDRVQLEATSLNIEKAISKLGFSARIETINTMEAYLGSLPGHGVENVRRPLINTLNLADLLPTSTIWTGENNAPCPFYPPEAPALAHCVTDGSTPFRLNLHVGDLGHTFLFGPTGAGKSTHLAFLATQLRRYKGMRIFAFDKGQALYPITKAVGGQHYSVAADQEQLAFCPLQYLETRSDRAFAMEWIDAILALNGINSTPTQRNEIGNAIISMHESGASTLSEFSLTVQDAAIREAITQYTVDGSMGHLLDADKDGLNLSNFTTFEIEELLNLGEKYALPVLLYLFRRIERSLDGKPSAIILDEAWIMLGHPVFREKIREWLKVLRKTNCIVIMATQSLSDASSSGILDVIVESTATKIFLPNLFARDEDAAALYTRMGLNPRQIEIIATAIPKRQYYFVSAKGRRLYELALGPLALAFVGYTEREAINKIKGIEERYGEKWVDVWLESFDLKLEA